MRKEKESTGENARADQGLRSNDPLSGVGVGERESGEPISDESPLESMPALSPVVDGLKGQLMELIRGNERLDQELRHARRAVVDGKQERKELVARMERLEQETVSRDLLESEIDRIRGERDTLAGRVMDLEESLSSSEQRVGEVGQIVDHLRAERDDMHEEAACLDAQFSRAMEVVTELRGALNNHQQRELQFEARIVVLEEHLQGVVGDRDSFELELNESRSTLENVRQSLVSVSREWRTIGGR